MKYILLLILLIPIWAFTQNHDYHWTLGYDNPIGGDTSGVFGGINIDFNHAPPNVYKVNRTLNFGSFSVACSDSVGKLLFYSNGIRIFNRENILMSNGDTINPGNIWNNFQNDGYPQSRGGLIIPDPANNNQYYIFHLAYVIDNGLKVTPLYFTHLDMKANGGKGRVTRKNVILLEGNLITTAITKHGNGRDWWLVSGQQNSNIVDKFLVTPEGIVGPFQQPIEIDFPLPEGNSSTLFSPDGTWYLRCDANNGLNLFSFDRCKGELFNHQFLAEVPDYFLCSGSAVFSADSKKLYVSDNRTVVIQFDLSDGILSYSRMDTVQQYDLFTDPFPPFESKYFFGQLGPDGKIYRAAAASTRPMHVVHRPDLPSPLCDLENRGLQLPRYNNFTVCYFPNYRLGVWEGSPCDTIQLQNPPPGFVKTSYEAFLEREARFRPHVALPPPDVLERLRRSPPRQPADEEPFDPANPKHITLRALAEKGVISQEEARRMIREE